MIFKLNIGITALIFALLSFTAPAVASTAVQQEINHARTHATMAVGATTMAKVHAHLHHAINCLAGPDGRAYDSEAADPCKGEGAGALPDAHGQPTLEHRLREALHIALRASNNGDIKEAHALAQQVVDVLTVKQSTPAAKQ